MQGGQRPRHQGSIPCDLSRRQHRASSGPPQRPHTAAPQAGMPTGGKQARPAARARRRCSLNSPCGRGGIHRSQGGKAALRRPGGRLLVQQRRPTRGCPPGSMRSCPNALTGAVLGRREARYSMSLDQDSAIHASGPGPVETLPTGPGGSHGKEQRLPYVPSGGVLQRLPRFRCTGSASKSGFQPEKSG